MTIDFSKAPRTANVVVGTDASKLVDKIAERAAFERTSTRIYDGLIAKYDAEGSFEGGPLREDLVLFREQELEHQGLLSAAMRMLGQADAEPPPSSQPVLISMGLLQVVADPRTTFGQALEAVLVSELADNDSWQPLIDLAKEVGPRAMVLWFEKARREEDAHLLAMRTWVSAFVRGTA